MKQRELAQLEERLGFRPRAAVRWLSPPQLLRTGVQALLAHTFLGFMDNRETQNMIPQGLMDLERFFTQQPEVAAETAGGRWVDFVADLGDGFDATYTVAWMLARPTLQVQGAAGGPTLSLPRAQVLVMGGDQVYPSASARDYEDRMVRPYRTASEAASDNGPVAALLALPGNHDWYDGLTSFRRMFCHHARIGGWQTLQSRGYFAARLTNPDANLVQKTWWLVALDSELGAYIDQPQLDYFRTEVTAKLKPGDAIILCAASPTWETTAELPDPDPNAYNSLRYFERHYLLNDYDRATGTLHPTGAQIRLRISGDKHHYVRYAQVEDQAQAGDDPRAEQLLTCGLGGAYLMGTDQAAEELVLPPGDSRERVAAGEQRHYRRAEAVYPTETQQSRLEWRLANPFSGYFLPWRNPWFGFWLGVLHLVLFMLLATVYSGITGMSYPVALGSGDWKLALGLLAFFFGVPPLLALVVRVVRILLAAPVPAVAEPDVSGQLPEPRQLHRQAQPVLIALLQFLVSAGLFLGAILFDWHRFLSTGWQVTLAATISVTVLGAVAGTLIFAFHLVNAPPGGVGKLKMTGLAYEDGKGFLRLHCTEEGTVVVYPVLVDRVVHDWDLAAGHDGQVRPVPADGAVRPRLIEDPITISMTGFDQQGGTP